MTEYLNSWMLTTAVYALGWYVSYRLTDKAVNNADEAIRLMREINRERDALRARVEELEAALPSESEIAEIRRYAPRGMSDYGRLTYSRVLDRIEALRKSNDPTS